MKIKNNFIHIFFYMLTLIFLFCSCQPVKQKSSEPISMIIATDLHYIASELLGNGDYFKELSANSDGKLIHYSHEITDAFFSEVIEQEPKLLILSGDLTLNGAIQSHQEFVEKLTTIQKAGIQVLVIPGNHDIDSVAASYANKEIKTVQTMDSDSFMTYYSTFGPSQAKNRDTASFSYIYEASDNLHILMLDTNCYGKGFVKEETLKWIEAELKEAQQNNVSVISVTHQNLFAHNNLLSYGYQLYNASELIELYEKYDVKCNLSGHIHLQSIIRDNITEIATSSLAISPIQYGKITYTNHTLTYTTQKTDVTAFAKQNDMQDNNFSNFSEYATNFFKGVAKEQIYSSFTDNNLSEKEKTLLAETFAQINASYFSGEVIDLQSLNDGISFWRMQEPSFFQNYIESILSEPDSDNLNATIVLK